MLPIPLVAAATVLGLAATPALAHSTWIAKRGGEFTVVHGYGASDDAYDPATVGGAKALDAEGAEVPVSLQPLGRTASLAGAAEGEAAVLTATMAHGWWTEDAEGEWHNAPPEGFPGFRSAGQYTDHPVAVFAAPAEPGTPLGNPLEIVPLADPTALGRGDELPVRVLFEGEPLAGAEVVMDVLSSQEAAAPTDAAGETMLVVANDGLNVASVYHEVPAGERRARGYGATLAFAPVPEE